MLNAGIIPSSQRPKEYLLASYQKQALDKIIDKPISSIVDILRLQEEILSHTDAALKEMLVLLESDKPVNEIPFTLAKITILPKETK